MFWFKNIEKIKQQHEKEILKKANVVGVGVGLKQIKGKLTKKKVILVFVEKKKDLPELMAVDVIPKKIDGCRTDVVETGELWEMQEEMQDRNRYRPAPGGCSAMHSKGSACTLGCIVYKNGKTYLLGNQHCYLPKYKGIEEGAPILQPSPYDGGKIEDKIAIASETVEFDLDEYNLIDAALAEVINPNDVKQEILDIGRISPEMAEVKPGEEVQKRGRTSLHTKTRIIAVNVTALVNYRMADGNKETIKFKDQIFTQPFVEGGDSSSLTLNMKNPPNPIGLVFAGSDKVSILNKIQNVQKLLGFDFKSPFQPTEGWMVEKYLKPIYKFRLGQLVTPTGKLNVRATPSLKGQILTTLNPGTKLEIQDKKYILADNWKWWKVKIK